MKTLKESILSSTKTGKSAFKPKTREELKKIISAEIKLKGNNCSLNHIDVSKITNMGGLFAGSKFNGDISKWNVHKVEDMSCMFSFSKFNGDISEWDVSNVMNMCGMFEYSDFKQDISSWKINNECDIFGIFSCDDDIPTKNLPEILKNRENWLQF